MEMEQDPVIPHLIEEVPDFKAFIRSFIGMSRKQLVGHSNGRQYKFFVDDSGWPIMQYKLKCTNTTWEPKDGLKLWKEDAEHNPVLPEGDPPAVKPKKMTNEAEIVHGLDGYIRHWTKISNEDTTVEYKAHMSYLVTYWTAMRNAIHDSIGQFDEQPTVLEQGFWP
jgi:hypothetical protein